MKHFTLLVATLMLGIGTASYAATNGGGGGGTDCGCKDEDNPIKNGSFEQGTDFWHTTDGLDFKAEELYNVCGDNNGLLFGHGEIWQDVEVGPDHKVSVSVYGGTHDTHPVHKFKLVFLDENDHVIEGSGTEVNMDYAVGSNSELKQFFLDAITTEAVKKVRFIAYSEGGYFKVDVVCMTITPSMPVTLSAFNVTKEGSLATLKWSTATESNASHFDVQHSTDGKTWALLTSIEAKGESSTLQNYTYTHTAPSARNLYRLKMVDADETFAYSSIRNLNFGDVEMEIYPNPSSDRIRFSSARPVDNVKIFNTNGVMVMNAKPDASNEVDVRAIAQGIYFVKVNDGEMAKRIVVAR